MGYKGKKYFDVEFKYVKDKVEVIEIKSSSISSELSSAPVWGSVSSMIAEEHNVKEVNTSNYFSYLVKFDKPTSSLTLIDDTIQNVVKARTELLYKVDKEIERIKQL